MRSITTFILFTFFIVLCDFAVSKTSLPINQESYLLGFEKFRDSAKSSLGQNRVILIGGSSMAWGVSAKTLSERLGVTVLNGGIHANIGYRHFLGIIGDVLDKKNDLLIISPEYSTVSSDNRFDRSIQFCEIALYVKKSYPIECIGYSINKILRIFPIIDKNRRSDEYIRSGFNIYGDYIKRTDGKSMVGKPYKSDPCSGFKQEDLKSKYIPYMKSLILKGYKISYIPTFIPNKACKNRKSINEFHDILFSEFGINGFKNERLLFDEIYFYDTAYHLTIDGVSVKTNIFENQLRSLIE
jgi:hypothetical protein